MKPETTNKIRTICNTIFIIAMLGCMAHIVRYSLLSPELTNMQIFYDEILEYFVIITAAIGIVITEITKDIN